MRDMRYDMGMDGRRLPPRNSRGEFRRRRSRRDRAMDGRDMGEYGYDGGRGRDYGDYRGGDYGYDMRGDYGYRDYGDYGETLTPQELDKWCHKLKAELNDQERQMFSKEAIMQKAKQMGRPMEGFGEKELEVVVLMLLDDYKKTLGANPDIIIKLAFDWLTDKDASVKGAEKLAVYYDNIVEGQD